MAQKMRWNEIFKYDETSPSCLKWNVERWGGKGYSVKKVGIGDIAGSIDKASGYYRIKYSKNKYLAHRVIFEMYYGKIQKGKVIDHINGIRSDNRIDNLRLVTHTDNVKNQHMHKTNSSGIAGVNYDSTGDRWRAQWYDLNKRNHCKSFSVKKYGAEQAKQLAADYRAKMIEELNKQGAGYTERHGSSIEASSAS